MAAAAGRFASVLRRWPPQREMLVGDSVQLEVGRLARRSGQLGLSVTWRRGFPCWHGGSMQLSFDPNLTVWICGTCNGTADCNPKVCFKGQSEWALTFYGF
jgi:hypothetical protein